MAKGLLENYAALIDELVRANEEYARTFDRGHLPLPPARRILHHPTANRRSSRSPSRWFPW